MLTQPDAATVTRLAAGVARERLRRFRALFGGDDTRALSLYLADMDLAAELHRLLAVVEPVLREAMHRHLAAVYGQNWLTGGQGLLDDRSAAQVQEARRRAGAGASTGKVVAASDLGLWTGLLAPGGYRGQGSSRVRLDYEATLWGPALQGCFPHGAPTRATVERRARRVRYGRNRVAHHEPLVFGMTQPGQRNQSGQERRQHPAAFLADLRLLTAYVDPALGRWLVGCSAADQLIGGPLVQAALASSAADPSVELMT